MSVAEADAVFIERGYMVDCEKNLYVQKESGWVPVQKLKKHIYKLLIHGGVAYFIDNFGDCFAIGDAPVFIFGILGTPSFFGIHNGRLLALDAYQRLWVHELSGKLITILFVKSKCCEFILRNGYIAVLAKSDGGNNNMQVYNREYQLRLDHPACEAADFQPMHIIYTTEDGAFRFDAAEGEKKKM